MPGVAEPDVAIIRPAYDVVLVGGPIFVLDMGTLVYVPRAVMAASVMTSRLMASAMVTSAVMASTTVVTASMTSTFGVRRRRNSKSERCSNRNHERDLLQHFVLLPWLGRSLWQSARERALNVKGKQSLTKCARSAGVVLSAESAPVAGSA